MIDTVNNAIKTANRKLDYEQLGLTGSEYQKIITLLGGRRPTLAELSIYSVMWSEHCSYKSSKAILKQFGKKINAKMQQDLLAGIGENAGVVAIDNNIAVTFKIESHNHPSYIEPFCGAATGVGGIIRDIIAMGARPIAVMDSLHFGNCKDKITKKIMAGVV